MNKTYNGSFHTFNEVKWHFGKLFLNQNAKLNQLQLICQLSYYFRMLIMNSFFILFWHTSEKIPLPFLLWVYKFIESIKSSHCLSSRDSNANLQGKKIKKKSFYHSLKSSLQNHILNKLFIRLFSLNLWTFLCFLQNVF